MSGRGSRRVRREVEAQNEIDDLQQIAEASNELGAH
jgi:hypothetical protein